MDAERHWRPGEALIGWVEEAVSRAKTWQLLKELPPSFQYRIAYEAELHFGPAIPALFRRGSLWLRAHQEHSDEMLIGLWLGQTVLRRAHIGANHQEPDAGPVIRGPHIHLPTTAFPNIGTRGSRSRAYAFNIPQTASLRHAIQLFSQHVKIIGTPAETRRLEETNGM